MSSPPGTEMFQFPGFASPAYGFSGRSPKGRGCPIRTSADQRALASPRGFSQRATSFIASWRQGIHRTPFSRSDRATPHRTQYQTAPHASRPQPNPSTSSTPTNHSRFSCERTSRAGCRAAGAGQVFWRQGRRGEDPGTGPTRCLAPAHGRGGRASRVENGARRRAGSLKDRPRALGIRPGPRGASLKGGDPAAGSPTATLLRLHPSH